MFTHRRIYLAIFDGPICLAILLSLFLTSHVRGQEGVSRRALHSAKRSKNLNSLNQIKAPEDLSDVGPEGVPKNSPPINVLIPALLSLDKDVRFKAARLLGSAPLNGDDVSPEMIEVLIEALNSPETFIRYTAVRVLRNFGSRAEAAAPALIEALNDSDPNVRIAVYDALGSLRSSAAVPALISELESQNEFNRKYAAETLGDIGPDARVAVPALIEALKDKEGGVRLAVIEALGKIGPAAKAAIPVLIEGDKLDVTTIRTLMNLRPDAKVVIPIFTKILKEKSPSRYDSDVNVAAAIALGEIGPEAEAAVPALVEALKNQNERVRLAVIEALGKIGPAAKAAIPVLIEELNNNFDGRNTQLYGATVHTLGEMGSDAKAAIPTLSEGLYHEDKYVRISVAYTLNEISTALYDAKDTSALPLLEDLQVAMLDSEDPEIRKQADGVRRIIEYLKLLWWEQVIVWIRSHKYICFILVIYPLLFLAWLTLLWRYPLYLLRINNALPAFTDIELPKWLGGIKLPLRNLILVGFFQYHPRVLDAWVMKYIAAARNAFKKKATVEERDIYVPVPVVLNKETLSNVTVDNLRPLFSEKLAHLLILGEGGSGKTSLSCLFAKWAMSEEVDKRLCNEHFMLPVLLEFDIETQDKSVEAPFLKTIKDQLRVLIKESDHISTELLLHLLKERRLLVVVDGFSEMNEFSRQCIMSGIMDIPVNATVVTSRIDELLQGLPRTDLKPLRIRGNKLATFMEVYLSERRKRDLFDDEKFFEGCRQLSRIVGERDITALIAKYYADQMIASEEGVADENLPTNIPDLMLNYIDLINIRPAVNIPDIRVIIRALEVIAWECLRKTYRPMSAKREDIMDALCWVENIPQLLNFLEEHLKLIQSVGASRDRIRFTLDPLAEYLAGLHLVQSYGGDEELWCQLISKADEQDGTPETIKGFLLALRDCCLARKLEISIPDFVIYELTKRAGLNLEDKE